MNISPSKHGLGAAAILSLAACESSALETASPIDLDRPIVYVSDAAGVHAFDEASLAPLGQVLETPGVGEIHATPDGGLVWALVREEGRVYLLDTEASQRSFVDVGVSPVHSYLSPDRETIWVGNDGSSSVSIIDVATRTGIATVLTGDGHHKMALAPDEAGALDTVYVSNVSGSITPVSAAGDAGTNIEGVGPAPHGMDYSALTTEVYNCAGDIDPETEGSQAGIEVIATRDDPATEDVDERHRLVARIPLVDGRCGYLHVEDDGHAYFTLSTAGKLGRLTLPERTVEIFDLGGRPDKFAVVGDVAFVADSLAPVVSVVSLVDGTVKTIATGAPVDPASPPSSAHRSLRHHGDRLYVPNAFAGSVTVIGVASQEVEATLEGLTLPTNIAVAGPDGGSTYPR